LGKRSFRSSSRRMSRRPRDASAGHVMNVCGVGRCAAPGTVAATFSGARESCRDHKPVARLRRGDGSPHADDHVDCRRLGSDDPWRSSDPAIYATAAEQYGRNASLSGVEVRPSRLSGVRRIVDVVFSFTNRDTRVTEKHFVRVDVVTEEWPFLVTGMSPFYER
jgi:hypothetical protein